VPRRNFLITLGWDGGGFSGWQRLPGDARSVQGAVEAALARTLGEAVEITGAGRTDAGVHAEGQAASFHSRTVLSPAAILAALAIELPPDIFIKSCHEVDPRFHARFRAKSKVYRYRLHVGPRPDPGLHASSHHVPGPLDLEAMRAAARALEGEHDFTALTNAKEGRMLRTLDRVAVEASAARGGGQVVDLRFEAKGFLFNQVRIMAGALLAVGEGRLTTKGLEAILASRDRSKAPGALGAYGLCLVEVRY
jgi:tRNA pseudouridine38-40 synthase